MLDRFGARAVISLLVCIGAASAALFAASENGTTVILARAGIGIGMAAILMGSYKIFTTWFLPREFATLSGLLISIGNLGAIGATAPMVWMSEMLGWRGACMSMAVITLLLAVVMYLVGRDHPPQQDDAASSEAQPAAGIASGLRTVFSSSLFWRLAPLSFASYGALIAVQGLWGGPYLMDTCGLGKAAAGNILLAVPVGIICGAPLWGHLSDRLGRRKLPILLGQGAMLLIFSSLAMGLQLPRWGLFLQCWLLGLTGGACFVLYAQVKETFPLSIAGTRPDCPQFFHCPRRCRIPAYDGPHHGLLAAFRDRSLTR